MKFIIYLLILTGFCSGLSSTEMATNQRDSNLEILMRNEILNPMILDTILSMYGAEELSQSQKTLSMDALIEQAKVSLQSRDTLKKLFFKQYDMFTDQEIAELRAILENKSYQKYVQSSMSIYPQNIAAIHELLKEIINEYGTDKPAEETSAESKILNVTKENWNQLIEKSDIPVVVVFCAEWCPPCKNLKPILKDVSKKYDTRCKFARVDFDSQTELAKKFEIVSLPTILFFHQGKLKSRSTGFLAQKALEEKIQELISQ